LNYQEHLIRKAEAALADGGRIDMVLHAELQSAGLNTTAIEAAHAMKEQE